MFGISDYIMGALGLALVGGTVYHNGSVKDYQLQIANMEVKLIACSSSAWNLEASVELQNETIALQEANLTANLEELTKWRQAEPEVRYKTVYDVAERIVKVYVDRNITIGGECNASKDVNHAFKSISYDQL